MSTPAISHQIRSLNTQEETCFGAILLTASHNPGGPEEDFGIKFNTPNGGPAPESITNAIFENTKTISEFKTVATLPDVDLSVVAETTARIGDADFKVSVIHPTDDYAYLMGELFDFRLIRWFLEN